MKITVRQLRRMILVERASGSGVCPRCGKKVKLDSNGMIDVHSARGGDHDLCAGSMNRAADASLDTGDECQACNGKGYVRREDPDTGRVKKTTCTVCDGTGEAKPDTLLSQLDVDVW